MSGIAKAGFSFLKNLGKGGSKTSPTISSVKPTVNTTELGKKISEATKAVQKAKGSGAKLSQSIFELKNNMPITFKGNKTKTMSNTTKKRNEESKKMFDKTEGRIKRKFGGGADMGKKKTNVDKINKAFKPGNVPSKLKGFSKLPEKVQQKINKKLAKKV